MEIESHNSLQDRIPSTLAQTAVMGVLEHEIGRQRILTIMKEREGTTDFEDVVFKIIEKYLKIKTSERLLWIVGIIGTAFISMYITKLLSNPPSIQAISKTDTFQQK